MQVKQHTAVKKNKQQTTKVWYLGCWHHQHSYHSELSPV